MYWSALGLARNSSPAPFGHARVGQYGHRRHVRDASFLSTVVPRPPKGYGAEPLGFSPSNHLHSPSGHLEACDSYKPPTILLDTNPSALIFTCILLLRTALIDLGSSHASPLLLLQLSAPGTSKPRQPITHDLSLDRLYIQHPTLTQRSSLSSIHSSHLATYCLPPAPCPLTPLWWVGLP